MTILVTIKLPRNPQHNPSKKVTGPCPFSEACTDSTGEHHTTVVANETEVAALRAEYHITRVEPIR